MCVLYTYCFQNGFVISRRASLWSELYSEHPDKKGIISDQVSWAYWNIYQKEMNILVLVEMDVLQIFFSTIHVYLSKTSSKMVGWFTIRDGINENICSHYMLRKVQYSPLATFTSQCTLYMSDVSYVRDTATHRSQW